MILSNADAGVLGLVVCESEMEVGSAGGGGGFIVTGFPCGSSVSMEQQLYECAEDDQHKALDIDQQSTRL